MRHRTVRLVWTHETDKAVGSLKTAGGALVNWWRAATLDALIVGVLWLIGLELIRVPWLRSGRSSAACSRSFPPSAA